MIPYFFDSIESILIMIVFVPIVLFITLFVKVSGLKRKLKKVTEDLDALKILRPEGTKESLNTGNHTPTLVSVLPKVQSVAAPQPLNLPKETAETGSFGMWFKENLILKVGVLMVLIGFGWFVSYAFIHDWIGPVGRIALGLVTGALVTAFGTLRLGKNVNQGNTFTILGTAIAIISILAGQYIYNFFDPPIISLGIIFIISLYTSLVAMAYSQEKLAIYGIVIAFLAPYISGAFIDPVLLSTYLLVISIGMIWISLVKKWHYINAVGITGILLFGLSHFFGGNPADSKYTVLLISYLTSAVYLLISLGGLIRHNEKANASNLYITIVNTLIILGMTINIVPTIYQSLVIAGWMLVYAISGFIVFIKTMEEKLFYIHALVSVVLLGIATSIELSGPTLVIAFAIEAAIISIASYVVTGNNKNAENLFVLMALPAFLSLPSLTSIKWQFTVMQSDFVVLLSMAVTLGVLGLFLKTISKNFPSKGYPIAIIASSFYFYAIIWLSLHTLVDPDTAVLISLFVYTVVGLATHFSGIFKQNSLVKNYGMVLLVCVVARLVLVDVWQMDIVLRVITFVVIGVLFISTAFISKKQKAVAI